MSCFDQFDSERAASFSSTTTTRTTSTTNNHHQPLTTLTTTNHHITCLSVHNNLLYASSGSDVDVFDLTTYSHLDTITTPSSSGLIKSITFSNPTTTGNKKCDILITAHQDSKIRVWRFSSSTKSHRLITTLPTVKDRLNRFMIPNNYVSVRRHKKRLWIGHNDAVSGLTVDDTRGLMYSVSWDRTLKIWRTSDYKCLESVAAHDDAVNAVAVSGKSVYTASADGRIRVWETKEKEGRPRTAMKGTLEKHGSTSLPSTTVNALAFTGVDGSLLVSGGCDGEIVVWDREEEGGGGGGVYEKKDDQMMVIRDVLKGHEGAVLCLVDIGHGLFVSGSADRTVRIWGQCGGGGGDDRRSSSSSYAYACLGVLDGHKKPVRALALVGEDEDEGVSLVCSGTLDGEIKIWQIKYDF